MILVFIGCGSVVMMLILAAGTTTSTSFDIGIGALGGMGDWLGISAAFGLAVATVIYALAQCIGATIGAALLVLIIGPESLSVGGLGETAPFPGISL